MKKARMNISHSRFILFKLKIFGEIVTRLPKENNKRALIIVRVDFKFGLRLMLGLEC